MHSFHSFMMTEQGEGRGTGVELGCDQRPFFMRPHFLPVIMWCAFFGEEEESWACNPQSEVTASQSHWSPTQKVARYAPPHPFFSHEWGRSRGQKTTQKNVYS